MGIGVGCHTAANRAARRSAASLVPPIQIGGGRTGLGLTCMSVNETNRPANDTFPGVQQACQRRRYSLGREPRPWNGSPGGADSAPFHPTPIPAMTRPPDIRSSVASAFAVVIGFRYGMI